MADRFRTAATRCCAAVMLTLASAAALAPTTPAEAAEPAPEACPPTASEAAAVAPASPLPGTPPPPAQIIVCAGPLAITGVVFSHWAEIDRRSGSAKHPASPAETAKEVLGFLISADWVLDEAKARHVFVSSRTVRRAFERIRAQQFPKRGEFGRFLQSSGETVADLMFRVELTLLSVRIERNVVASKHSDRARARALAQFFSGFKRRWQAQTYCAPSYALLDCGRVLAGPL
jgi:hypothetical protein